MNDPLAIALVCPLPWPPTDEVGYRVAREADALARRGHRVTVLAAGESPDAVRAGRDAAERADVAADPGSVRVIAAGRAIRTTARRRMAGPIDLAVGLERVLGGDAFDVVHVHEPLMPTPLLASLRHTRARAVATFHRADPPAGVAFISPLVERALDRLDARVAASPAVRRTLGELLPGEYDVIAPGTVGSGAPPPGGGVMIVARGRDRAGLRFGLTVARMAGAEAVAPLHVLGPREAAWRTRAAVPKALRSVATVLPDDRPDEWMAALDDVATVVAVGADDVWSVVVAEARARGRVVVGPRTADADALVSDGVDGLLAPPFQAPAWRDAVRGLASAPATRREMGDAARAGAATGTWDDVAARVEDVYARVVAAPPRRGGGVVLVDPRVRPSAGSDLAAMAHGCADLGLDVVCVASPEGVALSRAVAAAAPPGLRVVDGREIATADGVVVGLFLTHDVPDGLPLRATLEAVRGQGGVTLVPHPESAGVPPPDALRALGDLIDCRELATGAMGAPGIAAVRDARRLGVAATSGSGAPDVGAVGGAGMMMRGFTDGRDFVEALAEAEPVVPRRGRRARARDRRRGRNS